MRADAAFELFCVWLAAAAAAAVAAGRTAQSRGHKLETYKQSRYEGLSGTVTCGLLHFRKKKLIIITFFLMLMLNLGYWGF